MIPLIKKLDIDEINTSLIAIRKLLNNVGITETNITNIVGKDYDAKIQELEEKVEADDTYSTTEVKTNKKWIDGKSIYRVTKHVWHNNTTTQGYTYNSSTGLYSGNFTTNAETIVSIEVNVKDNTGRWAVQKSQGYNNANNILWVSDTSIYHAIYAGTSGWSALDAFITLEYTKTTD